MITITNEQMVQHLKIEGWIREYETKLTVDALSLEYYKNDARGLQEHMWRECEEDLAIELVKERLFTKSEVKSEHRYFHTYRLSGMVLVPR